MGLKTESSLQDGSIELPSVLQHHELRNCVNVAGRQRASRGSLRLKGSAEHLGTQQRSSKVEHETVDPCK